MSYTNVPLEPRGDLLYAQVLVDERWFREYPAGPDALRRLVASSFSAQHFKSSDDMSDAVWQINRRSGARADILHPGTKRVDTRTGWTRP